MDCYKRTSPPIEEAGAGGEEDQRLPSSSYGTVCGKDIVLAINDHVFLFFITMPPTKVQCSISGLEITTAIKMNESSTATAVARAMRREGLDAS
ncbi:hypothetical protein ACLOJK_037320 [Asimina triloba]